MQSCVKLIAQYIGYATWLSLLTAVGRTEVCATLAIWMCEE